MADWIHCNLCYIQPGNGKSFLLTNCGHLYCQECSHEASKGKCQVCGNQCVTLPLTSQMKPDVEVFFTELSELHSRHTKQFTQVMDFQRFHRHRLQNHHNEKTRKIKEKMQQMESDQNSLREENQCLKRKIEQSKLANLNDGKPSRISPYQRPMCVNNTAPNTAQRIFSQENCTPQFSNLIRPTFSSQRFGSRFSSNLTPTNRYLPLQTPPSSGRVGGIVIGTASRSSTTPSMTPQQRPVYSHPSLRGLSGTTQSKSQATNNIASALSMFKVGLPRTNNAPHRQ